MARRERSFFFNNKTGALKSKGKTIIAATADNVLELRGADTGSAPGIFALGDDTNINLVLTPKGTGTVNIAAGNLNYAGTAITATGAELNILDGVTATTAELNILDGVTATTAELNYVDGVTSNIQTQLDAKAPLAGPTFTGTLTYATLNDGTTALTSTAAELNILDGVTATTTELNYVDGVTSAIQTQLDAKLALAGGTMSGAIAMGTNKITGMGDPTANQDAATKAYVDTQTSSIVTTTDIAGDTGTDTVTLGSDTLTFSGTANEITTSVTDNTVTISLPDDVTIGSDLTVTGNLTVNGTTTTISTTNSVVSDSLIELNTGAGSNANDLGFVFERGSTGDNAAIIWDESADTFVMGTTTATGASTGDLTITAGALSIGSLTLSGTAVTSTAAELNILDGVTATAAELNILDGVTATTAELNILDGDTAATSTTLVDADRFVVNDAGTMVQVAASDVATYIGAGTNVFKTISVAGQSDVVADSATDTLTLAAGSGISLTTDASADTITFTSVSTESVFRTDTNLGNVADSHTASEDLGNTADSASDTYDLGTIAVQGVVVSGVVAGLSNASSGFVQANGDGTFSIGTPVEDNGVTTAKIADSNVTTAKIADSNVTTAKIADDAVTGVKLSGLTDASSGFVQADGDGTFSIGTPAAASITDGTSTLDFNGSNQVQSDASIVPNANGTLDLGTDALRWQNIYTSDLNLSNGIGDYTVVEGEEDLFLYNNKSGKVFKFALIEVDPSEATPKIEDLKNGD